MEHAAAASATVSASAPGRVNLLGEHTDYNDGYVLPTAIARRTRVEVRPSDDAWFRVHSSELHESSRFTLDAPPAEHFAQYVYGCLRVFEPHAASMPPLDIRIASDVPIGVGLSSSAALEVAVLRCLRALLNADIDDVTIAQLAQRAEREYAGVNCGVMDQMASSLAEPGRMLFLDTRTLEREVLPMPDETEIAVIHSGVTRSLAESGYNQRRSECEAAARHLGVTALRDVPHTRELEALPEPLRQRARHVLTENRRVLRARVTRDAAEFGRLMSASHASLRDDFEVSVPELDTLVSLLEESPSVYGARLTGAGFGGACVALCRAGGAYEAASAAVAQHNSAGGKAAVLLPERPA
jgi:galactokinase